MRVHGDGVNNDDFETRDGRRHLAGTCSSVEPGIYLEGVGGIRIEDDVVVRNGGIENLTNLRKDLIEVG